jgi:hypothetical protein
MVIVREVGVRSAFGFLAFSLTLLRKKAVIASGSHEGARSVFVQRGRERDPYFAMRP